MKARDLPATKHWTGGLIRWQQNGTWHSSEPFAIEHAGDHTYLHHEAEHRAGYAHELRGDQEVEASLSNPCGAVEGMKETS